MRWEKGTTKGAGRHKSRESKPWEWCSDHAHASEPQKSPPKTPPSPTRPLVPLPKNSFFMRLLLENYYAVAGASTRLSSVVRNRQSLGFVTIPPQFMPPFVPVRKGP